MFRKLLSGALPSIPLTSQPPAGPRYGGSGSDSFESPRLSGGYQLVPSGGFDINGVEERLRQLEVRMTIAERSGRTVWEETLRTQTELRYGSKNRMCTLSLHRDTINRLYITILSDEFKSIVVRSLCSLVGVSGAL